MKIDPSNITDENIPAVLGAIVVELQNLPERLEINMNATNQALTMQVESIENRLCNIEAVLREHDRIFWKPIKISRCEVIPFMKKNKWLLLGLWSMISIWLGAIDWIVRAIQLDIFFLLR